MVALALVLTAIPERAASPLPQLGGSEPVPAFHTEVPKGPLPATLDPAQFDTVVVQNAYASGGESEARAVSAAVLLPLRSQPGPRQPAGLLCRETRGRMRRVHSGSALFLRANARRARPRRKFATESKKANGSRWTCPSIRRRSHPRSRQRLHSLNHRAVMFHSSFAPPFSAMAQSNS